jgi:hypothetical protein
MHSRQCIDACDDVLGRLGKPGLIFYSWGEKGDSAQNKKPWYGGSVFQDGRRFALVLSAVLRIRAVRCYR